MKQPKLTLEPIDELNPSDLSPCSFCDKRVPRSTTERNRGLCTDCLDSALKANWGEKAFKALLMGKLKEGKLDDLGITLGVKVVKRDEDEEGDAE